MVFCYIIPYNKKPLEVQIYLKYFGSFGDNVKAASVSGLPTVIEWEMCKCNRKLYLREPKYRIILNCEQEKLGDILWKMKE